MASKQGFPVSNTPFLDENGNVSQEWLIFFNAIYKQTVSPNAPAISFNFPATSGDTGQWLTSQGDGKATIWTGPLTKVGQLVNDEGYVNQDQLNRLNISGTSATAARQYVNSVTSNSVPLPDAVTGLAGTSVNLSRADHVHPFATKISLNGVTIQAGYGPPTGVIEPNASLYLNKTGGAGTRLYVSSGSVWTAVPGV